MSTYQTRHLKNLIAEQKNDLEKRNIHPPKVYLQSRREGSCSPEEQKSRPATAQNSQLRDPGTALFASPPKIEPRPPSRPFSAATPPARSNSDKSALSVLLQTTAEVLDSYIRMRISLSGEEQKLADDLVSRLTAVGVRSSALAYHDSAPRAAEVPVKEEQPLVPTVYEDTGSEYIPYVVIKKAQEVDVLTPGCITELCDKLKECIPVAAVHVWLRHGGHIVRMDHNAAVEFSEGATETTTIAAAFVKQKVVNRGSSLLCPFESPIRGGIGVLEILAREGAPFAAERLSPTIIPIGKYFSQRIALAVDVQARMNLLQQRLSDTDLLLKVAHRLAHDVLDEEKLSKSIMETAREVCDADRCTLFVLDNDEVFAILQEGQRLRMDKTKGLVGHVIATGEIYNTRDAYTCPYFNSAVDSATGYRTRTILTVPVKYEDAIVAVAQLVNKKPKVIGGVAVETYFNESDEQHFEALSTFVGLSLRNCRKNQELRDEKRKTEAFFYAVSQLSRSDLMNQKEILINIRDGIFEIIPDAQDAFLFVIDKEKGEVRLAAATVLDADGQLYDPGPIAFGEGIVGTVATTGQAISENNCQGKTSLYSPATDSPGSKPATNLLCTPLLLHDAILGILVITNKLSCPTPSYENRANLAKALSLMGSQRNEGTVVTVAPDPKGFTRHDMEMVSGYCLFAAIALHNADLLAFAVKAGRAATKLTSSFQTAKKAKKRSSISVSQNDVSLIMRKMGELNSKIVHHMTRSTFDLFRIRRKVEDGPIDIATAIAARLITGANLHTEVKCAEETLVRFILALRALYHNVPYHNFYHAIDVLQTIYTILYSGEAHVLLTAVEQFVLLVTALAHDVDHMGLNNSFHLKSDSPLGILSSATGNQSVLEIHHCNVTVDLLRDPLMNVFGGLGEAEATAVRLLVDCILATDMSKHSETSTTLDSMGPFDRNRDEHRRFAMQTILKCADISNVAKPFEISRQWGALVVEEFSNQGDHEKKKGMDVLPMFDRAKNANLAKGQIGFIDFVAKPFFSKVVNQLLTGCTFLVENIERNRALWEEAL